MSRVRVTMKANACSECLGDMVFEADVGPLGYSAGSGIDHALICPTRMCPHGRRRFGPIQFQQECRTCDDALLLERDAARTKAHAERKP